MGCCWIDVRKFPWATKNPLLPQKENQNKKKNPLKNKQKRSNNLQKKGFYNLETASGFSVFFLLLLLLWVCRDLKFRSSKLAASSSSSLTDFRLWSSGLQISSYFELLVITRFLCCDHPCVLCFFALGGGFFFFFSPPFRFVHFSEFTEHLISVFWDCCSLLCFWVCWFCRGFLQFLCVGLSQLL